MVELWALAEDDWRFDGDEVVCFWKNEEINKKFINFECKKIGLIFVQKDKKNGLIFEWSSKAFRGFGV